MKKFIISVYVLLFSGCIPYEAGSIRFVTELKNSCEYPITITVSDYVFYPEERPNGNRKINPNEVMKVLDFYCEYCVTGVIFVDSNYSIIKKYLTNEYILEIIANGHKRTFSNIQFLELLKNAEYTGVKWIINDTSICPY
jgi:hypothetical protein